MNNAPSIVTFDARDYVRAYYLALRPRRWLRWLGYPLVVAYVLIAIVTLWQAVRDGRGWELAAVLWGIGAYWLVRYFVLLPRRWRRLYRQQKTAGLPTEILVTSEGFRSKSELGEVTIPWSYMHKWRRGRHAVLLYHSDVLFNILPKRVMPAEEVEALEQLISEKLGPSS